MPWLLVDLTLGVLALLVLGAVALALYRRVRVLIGTLRQAETRVGDAMAGMHGAQESEREERLTTT